MITLSDTMLISGHGDEELGHGDGAGLHGIDEPDVRDMLLLLFGDG